MDADEQEWREYARRFSNLNPAEQRREWQRLTERQRELLTAQFRKTSSESTSQENEPDLGLIDRWLRYFEGLNLSGETLKQYAFALVVSGVLLLTLLRPLAVAYLLIVPLLLVLLLVLFLILAGMGFRWLGIGFVILGLFLFSRDPGGGGLAAIGLGIYFLLPEGTLTRLKRFLRGKEQSR